MDKALLDITNCIFIAADKKLTENDFCAEQDNLSKIENICPYFENYLKDIYKIYN